MLNFEKLRTPAGDGDVLIEPRLETWPALIEQNAANRCAASAELAGVSVGELREITRAAMGAEGDKPIIAAGHQPAFIHPGVWAKYVLVRFVAQERGLHAFDLVVDHDAPPSGALSVPVLDAGGYARVEKLEFYSGARGSPYEGRPALAPEQVLELSGKLAGLLGESFGKSLMPRYLEGIAGVSPADSDAVEQHLAGRAAVDSALDGTLPEFRVSSVFGGPFVADLLLNAGRFAQSYNAALAEYRVRESVRSPHRPLPDLGRDGERIETALWIYKPHDLRRRLWVEAAGDCIRCYADATLAGCVSMRELKRDAKRAIEGLHPFVIRPRALTLTLWARLLATDLFVHGIGGAKYDRITDGIFADYYRCKPPAIAAATATLRLPLKLFPVSEADLLAARRDLRDIRFNPPRYIHGIRPDLLRRRTGLIRESIDFREDRAPSLARRELWQAIHTLNEVLLAADPRVPPQLAERARRLAGELESNRVAASREYFYALQPRSRLEMLADRLRGACHVA
jgi:hypothetical protein